MRTLNYGFLRIVVYLELNQNLVFYSFYIFLNTKLLVSENLNMFNDFLFYYVELINFELWFYLFNFFRDKILHN